MLDLAVLGTLARLVEQGNLDIAKDVAAVVLETAGTEELDTIMATAEILDSHATKPVVGMARVKAFARDLPDDHHRALVAFCAAYTGDRPNWAPAPPAYEPLSIYQDHRPGFDPHDAEPLGLTVTADPGEETAVWKARRAAQLTPRLRDDIGQLPRPVRAALLAPPEKRTDATARRTYMQRAMIDARNATAQNAEQWFHDNYERNRLGVKDADAGTTGSKRAAGRAVRMVATQAEPAPRTGTDYTRVWLGVRDIDKPDPDTATPDPTKFDLYPADDTAEENADQLTARPLTVTPCVSCWIERSTIDARRRADDGLCTECRERGRTGLDHRAVTVVRLPAYLSRPARVRGAVVTAGCARVAAQMPRDAAKHWLRAYYRMSATADRDTIELWVKRWDAIAEPATQSARSIAGPRLNSDRGRGAA